MKTKKRGVVVIITIWMMIAVVITYALSLILTYVILSRRSEKSAWKMVVSDVEDVSNDLEQMVEASVLSFMEELVSTGTVTTANIPDPEAFSRELQSRNPVDRDQYCR